MDGQSDICVALCYSDSTKTPVLYTALNVLSLILTLQRSETDSPSLKFAHSPILLHKSLYMQNSISPILNSPSGWRAKIKRGQIFPVYSITIDSLPTHIDILWSRTNALL